MNVLRTTLTVMVMEQQNLSHKQLQFTVENNQNFAISLCLSSVMKHLEGFTVIIKMLECSYK